MESGAIPDDSITASSYYDSEWLPRYARLNVENGGFNFWIPRPTSGSWIQVDLGLPIPVVTGVIVQGVRDAYVSTFGIQYSDNGNSESWTSLVDTNGDTKQFNGNVGDGQQVTVNFPVVLRTRFLRILPLTWVYVAPRLDFEVLGCRDGIVRLAGGDDALQGRVEIYHDGGWGAVCDTNWDFKDATTVCRQLGFLEASEAKIGSYFGATDFPTVMDRVACKGTESYLSDCAFVCSDVQSCNNTAGVVCKPNTIRLVGGRNKTSGGVELFKKNTWGAICDTDWDIVDAGVVCRQLGFSGAKEAKSGSYFGEPEGPSYMQGVSCDGSEAKITDCPSHYWDEPKCNSTKTAGVVCLQGNMESEIGEIPALQ